MRLKKNNKTLIILCIAIILIIIFILLYFNKRNEYYNNNFPFENKKYRGTDVYKEPECPDGTNFNKNANNCVSDTLPQVKCPKNFELRTVIGVGENKDYTICQFKQDNFKCPKGMNKKDGYCQFNLCNADSTWDKYYKKCILNTNKKKSTPTKKCSAPSKKDENNGLCLTCPNNLTMTEGDYNYCYDKKYKVQCEKGYYMKNNYCIKDPVSCPPDYILNDNECIWNGNCGPDAYIDDDGYCYNGYGNKPPCKDKNDYDCCKEKNKWKRENSVENSDRCDYDIDEDSNWKTGYYSLIPPPTAASAKAKK